MIRKWWHTNSVCPSEDWTKYFHLGGVVAPFWKRFAVNCWKRTSSSALEHPSGRALCAPKQSGLGVFTESSCSEKEQQCQIHLVNTSITFSSVFFKHQIAFLPPLNVTCIFHRTHQFLLNETLHFPWSDVCSNKCGKDFLCARESPFSSYLSSMFVFESLESAHSLWDKQFQCLYPVSGRF